MKPEIAKVGVGGSNPLARSSSLNDLGGQTDRPDSSLSAECPRNVFAPCSGSNELARPSPNRDSRNYSGDKTALTKGVRERSGTRAGHRSGHDSERRPAHPSNRLVVPLNAVWRVVDDPLQWILQRKKGNPRSKNSGWENRSFCTSREGLLRCIRERGGEVEQAAFAKLSLLPQHHAMENLDVHGTDQAQAKVQSEPLASQGLEGLQV